MNTLIVTLVLIFMFSIFCEDEGFLPFICIVGVVFAWLFDLRIVVGG